MANASRSPGAKPWYRRLGPALLAGAADDDPSAIAVYMQAGSQFGLAICFSRIDSMKALYWSAVLNGIAAIPMLVMVMLLASRRDIARELRSGALAKALGWLAVAAMTVATAVMIVDLVS